MKVLLARTVCDAFKNQSAMEAAKAGIVDMENRVKGLGGVVGIHYQGDYAFYHKTQYMAMAYFDNEAGIVAKIDMKEKDG